MSLVETTAFHGSSDQALERFLARLLRHSELTDREQTAILGLSCHPAQMRPRQDIVSPGRIVDHACLIGKGLAARFDQMRNGRRQTTALHIPGDMADLHSVVRPKARWSITALAPTTVLRVPHVELRRLADTHQGIALAFWRDASIDASTIAKWLVCIGQKNARERVAHLFCEMGVRLETAGFGARHAFDLPMTQDQIADAVGITAVHLNRTMQDLRSTSIFSFNGGLVEISDWSAFAAIADFDPTYMELGNAEQP
jgi:CRP-like cAMP-binding protein